MASKQDKRVIKMWKKLIEWLYLKTKDNLVYYDSLTGCYSRNYYKRVLIKSTINQEWNVVVLDLNNLKKVNDVSGHSAGDALLKGIAEKLQSFGIAVRLGGDEFLLLLDDDGYAGFKNYADQNDEFCYAYIKKEKGEKLNEIFEEVDIDLVCIKDKYRKSKPRGADVNLDDNMAKICAHKESKLKDRINMLAEENKITNQKNPTKIKSKIEGSKTTTTKSNKN